MFLHSFVRKGWKINKFMVANSSFPLCRTSAILHYKGLSFCLYSWALEKEKENIFIHILTSILLLIVFQIGKELYLFRILLVMMKNWRKGTLWKMNLRSMIEIFNFKPNGLIWVKYFIYGRIYLKAAIGVKDGEKADLLSRLLLVI